MKLIASFLLFSLLCACSNLNLAQNDNKDIAKIDNSAKSLYATTGKTATDFLPKTGEYHIQYQAQGDLNGDKLVDIALVLQHNNDKQAIRPILILLKNKDKSYHLDKVSNVAMPIEFNEYDYKNYDSEEINIHDKKLIIQLYSTGVNGNLFSNFEYKNRNLYLTYIEVYAMGAGSHYEASYEVATGIFEETETNTMREDIPTTTKTFQVKPKQKWLFEKTSPDEVFNKVSNDSK